jgi:hypothetical protein
VPRKPDFSLVQLVESLLEGHAGDDTRLLALKVTTAVPYGELTDALTQALLLAIPVIRHNWSLRVPGRDGEKPAPDSPPSAGPAPTFGTDSSGSKYASPAAAMMHSRPEFRKRWGVYGAAGWVPIDVATQIDLEHAIGILSSRARTSMHRAGVLKDLLQEMVSRDVRLAGDLPQDTLTYYYSRYRTVPMET